MTTFDATTEPGLWEDHEQARRLEKVAALGYGSEVIGGRHYQGMALVNYKLREKMAESIQPHADDIARRTDARVIRRLFVPACAVAVLVAGLIWGLR